MATAAAARRDPTLTATVDAAPGVPLLPVLAAPGAPPVEAAAVLVEAAPVPAELVDPAAPPVLLTTCPLPFTPLLMVVVSMLNPVAASCAAVPNASPELHTPKSAGSAEVMFACWH
jgi:hypothetical protein